MLGFVDLLLRGSASGTTLLPNTKTGYLARQLLIKARAAAVHQGRWGTLAEAIRAAVIMGGAQGFKASSPQEADAAVNVGKAILFSERWTQGMTEAEVRKQAKTAMDALWAGGVGAPPPDVFVAANDACSVQIPVMGENYGELFEKRGGDWAGGCEERMARLRTAWDGIWAKGGPMGASMTQIRYAYADMARQRAGASWSNSSSAPARLPGDLRAFIIAVGNIAAPVVGAFAAEALMNEAEG